MSKKPTTGSAYKVIFLNMCRFQDWSMNQITNLIQLDLKKVTKNMI